MTPDSSAFGLLVRNLRLARRLRQQDLAARTHFAQSYISQLEHGIRRPPTAMHVHNLAIALDSDIAEEQELFRVAGFLPIPDAQAQAGGAAGAEALPGEPHQLAARLLTGAQDRRQQHVLDLDDVLPAHRSAIAGFDDLLRTAIALVQEAPPRRFRRHGDSAIAFVCQGTDLFHQTSRLRNDWLSALHTAMERGWDIHHLVRLDRANCTAFSYIEDMLAFLDSETEGRYAPSYFEEQERTKHSYGILIVPRRGAIQFFWEESDSANVHGRFYPANGERTQAIATLQDHVGWLTTQATPLVRSYSPASTSLEFYDAVRQASDHEGDRIFVFNRPSELSLPRSVDAGRIAHVVQAGGERARIARSILLNRQRRREAFLKQIRRFRYRDIYPRSAVERLAATGRFENNWLMRLGARDETVEERILHLRQLIGDIEHFDNYEIGLLSDAEAAQYCRTLWTVKGSYSACIQVVRPNFYGKMVNAALEIREPLVVSAFQQYFAHIWNRIDPANRDKRETVAWLKRLVAMLESRGQGAGQ